jgi:peptidyl-tRNA hydrolase, PTH1 family
MSERLLIVGLGNPGREYKKNRHNVGFQIVDQFAARHGLEFSRQQSNAVIASGTIAGRAVTLAKPMTFMNRSGGPVSALMRFYKLEPEQLLVIVDDLDLPTGTVRLKPEGGSGGQNGMKDIISRLATQSFPRMRIGIGRPPGKMDSAAYVLQDFSTDQQALIDVTYERASDAVETWLRDGIVLAMSRHNAPAEQE